MAAKRVSDGEPKRSKADPEVEPRARQAQRAAIVLKLIGDPTRLQIVIRLAEGEKRVGALADELNQSPSAISHHLALLRHGGIIRPRRQGKKNFYILTDAGEALIRAIGPIMR